MDLRLGVLLLLDSPYYFCCEELVREYFFKFLLFLRAALHDVAQTLNHVSFKVLVLNTDFNMVVDLILLRHRHIMVCSIPKLLEKRKIALEILGLELFHLLHLLLTEVWVAFHSYALVIKVVFSLQTITHARKSPNNDRPEIFVQ